MPWSGPAPAEVVILGEAPGRQENGAGKPFVGPAGQLARRWLTTAGLDPETVAWVNTVSCWPHGTPTPEHVTACAGNLKAQLELLQPSFILCLGNVASNALLLYPWTMTQLHGRWWQTKDKAWAMSTWHPASILRGQDAQKDYEAGQDIARFTHSVLLQDLAKPQLTESCIRCGK